ncbi:MAG: cysteine desulfurase NifS [Candidatus Diapherotrites archaeon]|nr:cysteine desulfurase NifS [Candidatus Diapherotrites archaeon]
MRRIYLDHAATTPIDGRALAKMRPYFSEKYGNAGSLHYFGTEAKKAMENARAEIARAINAEPNEIIFTSGGTESDNLAIKGIAYANSKNGNHIITSVFEHHAVLHTCKFLEKDGFKVTYLEVDSRGFINPKELESAITEKTILVSVMHANNEIGTIQPIGEIGKICRERGIYFHTDAVQTLGKIQIDVKKMNIDLLSASAHKFYGPKGVGFLYVRKGTNIHPLMHGGGQENGLRSGTENVAGIIGMAEALKISIKEMGKENARELKLRNKLIKGCLKIKDSWLNGSLKNRLAGNANLGFDFVEGESIVIMLDEKGIAASTGSACSTKSLEPSHVLRAIGLPHVKCHGSLRLTLGRDTTTKDIDYLLNVLPAIIARLREMSPLRKGIDISEFEGKIEHTHEGHAH